MYMSLQNSKQALSIDYINVSYDYENTVIIRISNNREEILSTYLIPKIVEFIIQHKEDKWILSMLADMFYFTEYEEQMQILEITKSLLDGENKEAFGVSDYLPRDRMIAEELAGFLQGPIYFSFESFLKFRLRSYTETLLKFIELAIDEYKLEQEYQTFIQGLREFTADRESKIEQLHILHEDQLKFFNEQLIEIRSDTLRKYVDRKLIQSQPMYIDSAVLAPLVSISPKSIHIYTDEIDNGMIQTIHNIFLEKVNLFTKKHFDDLRQKKNIT